MPLKTTFAFLGALGILEILLERAGIVDLAKLERDKFHIELARIQGTINQKNRTSNGYETA
jgi:hypothetical protein